MDIANKVSSVLTSPYETAREFINEITNEIKTSTSPATSQKVIKVIKAFIKNKKNQPSQKLRALQLHQACMMTSNGFYLEHNAKKFMRRLGILAIHNKQSQTLMRGTDLFGKQWEKDTQQRDSSIEFLLTLLDNIRVWKDQFGLTATRQESPYMKQYNMLVQQNVIFPPPGQTSPASNTNSAYAAAPPSQQKPEPCVNHYGTNVNPSYAPQAKPYPAHPQPNPYATAYANPQANPYATAYSQQVNPQVANYSTGQMSAPYPTNPPHYRSQSAAAAPYATQPMPSKPPETSNAQWIDAHSTANQACEYAELINKMCLENFSGQQEFIAQLVADLTQRRDAVNTILQGQTDSLDGTSLAKCIQAQDAAESAIEIYQSCLMQPPAPPVPVMQPNPNSEDELQKAIQLSKETHEEEKWSQDCHTQAEEHTLAYAIEQSKQEALAEKQMQDNVLDYAKEQSSQQYQTEVKWQPQSMYYQQEEQKYAQPYADNEHVSDQYSTSPQLANPPNQPLLPTESSIPMYVNPPISSESQYAPMPNQSSALQPNPFQGAPAMPPVMQEQILPQVAQSFPTTAELKQEQETRAETILESSKGVKIAMGVPVLPPADFQQSAGYATVAVPIAPPMGRDRASTTQGTQPIQQAAMGTPVAPTMERDRSASQYATQPMQIPSEPSSLAKPPYVMPEPPQQVSPPTATNSNIDDLMDLLNLGPSSAPNPAPNSDIFATAPPTKSNNPFLAPSEPSAASNPFATNIQPSNPSPQQSSFVQVNRNPETQNTPGYLDPSQAWNQVMQNKPS